MYELYGGELEPYGCDFGHESDPDGHGRRRILVGFEDSRSRYAGVLMTSAGKIHSNNQTAGFVELFYLKIPAAGANTVAVTVSGGTVPTPSKPGRSLSAGVESEHPRFAT